ncbi:MAG: Tex-like N-terminal domain-containing protein, partial [Bilophila sp.]
MEYTDRIAKECGVRAQQVAAVVELLDADATVPFIARYRKEATGSLDEVVITTIRDRLAALKELDKRREAVISSLTERDLLTVALKNSLDAAQSLTVLEDLYLPYRPKRRTRASNARERGLEPLALFVLRQDAAVSESALTRQAEGYVNAEKGVADVEAALSGARDILAEQ